MKNREYFLREDISTCKPKYLLLCNNCEITVRKFASVKNKEYISRILITDKNDK